MTKNKRQTMTNNRQRQTSNNVKQEQTKTNDKQRRFPPYNRLEQKKKIRIQIRDLHC